MADGHGRSRSPWKDAGRRVTRLDRSLKAADTSPPPLARRPVTHTRHGSDSSDRRDVERRIVAQLRLAPSESRFRDDVPPP